MNVRQPAPPGWLHHLLWRAAADRPGARAVSDGRVTWDYRKLRDKASQLAAALASRQVRAGDRVVGAVPYTAPAVALMYACSMLGAVFVPARPTTGTAELDTLISEVQPTLLITGDHEPASWGVPAVTLEELGAAGTSQGRAAVGRRAGAALLLQTSGSSAVPRIVICPHSRVLFAVTAISGQLGYRPGDVVYCRLPLTFDYGLYQALLCAQAQCELVLDDAAPGLAVLSRMRACGATVVPLVPPLAEFLAFLASRTSGTPPVRLFTNTGAPLGAAITAALRRSFPRARICLMYGLTECKRVAIMPPDHDLARPASSGLPLPDTAVRILAGGLPTSEPGVQGEIIVEGPHVMAGYWRDHAATAARFRRDPATGRRQLHTGDLGWLDSDGYLYVAGRLDDMFNWRGLRMSRQEVETAALSIPGVSAAAVLPPAGHRDMTLFAVGRHSGPALLRLMADRLDAGRVPTTCVVLDRLPVTDRGKIDLGALAAIPGLSATVTAPARQHHVSAGNE